MANISVEEAQAWCEPTKLTLGTLDTELEAEVAAQVLARVAPAYDTSSWTSEATTPKLVRSIIAMLYVAATYHRTFSTEAGPSEYGLGLEARAERLLEGVASDTIDLPDAVDSATEIGTPEFYPNDESDALGDTSPAFYMGTIF